MKRAHKDDYELYSRSCLLAFETWSNPISRSQLVPIGILVSSTATPSKPRSHQGQGCVLSSQVNHPSNMPATGLKLTDQDRVGDTLSEGLNRSGGTQRSTQNLTTKSSAEAAPSLHGQNRNRCGNLVNWRASCGSQAQRLFAAAHRWFTRWPVPCFGDAPAPVQPKLSHDKMLIYVWPPLRICMQTAGCRVLPATLAPSG